MTYQLSYAGIPFMGDRAQTIRYPEAFADLPVDTGLWSQECDLYQEVDRILPFLYLQDIEAPPDTPGKNTSDLARRLWGGPFPDRHIRIGDFYYPTGMSRFSVFRGLASTSMVAAMLAATAGNQAKPFILQSTPFGSNDASYQITTNLYMLPPRILGEHGGSFDGVYLVTLVDDRYYFQQRRFNLTITGSTQWTDLLSQLANVLGITLTYSVISSVYGQPEADSQLWNSGEPAALLLDAVAFNLGRVVLRNLDGTYSLQTAMEAKKIVLANRGDVAKLNRFAGGDLLQSGRSTSQQGANAILPNKVVVSFPQYIWSDPIPHYHNPRYLNTRWVEDSQGGVFSVSVPLTSAGLLISGGWGMAMSGVGQVNLTNKAKAHYSGYSDGNFPNNPLNASGLTALAMQLAQDFCYQRIASNLDEVYPGTYLWTPEGLHDIIWTYREMSRLAGCRVLRRHWQDSILQFQHSLPPLAGSSNQPAGIGGKAVCQTVYDSFSGFTSSTKLANTLNSGDSSALFSVADYFPTKYRWKGKIDQEVILFEGTSGSTTISIVQRAMDGTSQVNHVSGATVAYQRNMTHGVNAVHYGEGLFAFTDTFSSGGVFGAKIPAQIQTVKVFSASGLILNNTYHYSGQICLYDASQQPVPFTAQDYVWVIERNAGAVMSGALYPGQLAGFSTTGSGAYLAMPLFLVDGKSATPPVVSGGILISGASASGFIPPGGITGVTVQLDDNSVIIANVNTEKLHAPSFKLNNIGGGVGVISAGFGVNIQPTGQVSSPGNTQLIADAGHVHAAALPIWNVQNIFNLFPYEQVIVYNSYLNALSFWDLNTWWCIAAVPCYECGVASGVQAPCPPVIPITPGWIDVEQSLAGVSLLLNWQQTAHAMGYVIISYIGSYTGYAAPAGWTLGERFDGNSQDLPTIEVYYRSLDGTETGAVSFSTGYSTMGAAFAIRGGQAPEVYGTISNNPGPQATAQSITSYGTNRIILGIFAEAIWRPTILPLGMTPLASINQASAALGNAGLELCWESVNLGATGNFVAQGGNQIATQLLSIPVNCLPVLSGGLATTSGSAASSGSASSGSAASGGSSSGGGGGNTVAVACCPSLMPNTIFVTLTGISCLAGTYTLTYAGSSVWEVSGINSCGGQTISIHLLCSGTSFILGIFCDSAGGNTSTALTSYTGTCSPLNLSFAGQPLTCGTGTGTIAATVTG